MITDVQKQQLAELHRRSVAERKNGVCLYLGMLGSGLSFEAIYDWFQRMTFFKPARITVTYNAKHQAKRYKDETLRELLHQVMNACGRFLMTLEEREGGEITDVQIDPMSCCFRTRLSMDIWYEHKEEILRTYEEFFRAYDGFFGFAVNRFDHEIVQNPRDAEVYEQFELTDADYEGVRDIPHIPFRGNAPVGPKRVDPSYLPGSLLRYDEIFITSAPYMWVGPDFYLFVARDTVEHIGECEENREFAAGYRRICLWDDIRDYNAPDYRKRQWAFRENLCLDDVVKAWSAKPTIAKNADAKPDPAIEMHRGQFEHGGTTQLRFYVDQHGNSVARSIASHCMYQELDDGNLLWQERQIME